MAEILTYTGKALEQKQGDLDNYLPSDDLIDAINLAIQLKRPLLVMGESGCGKTRLAEAVAYELHKDKMSDHYFRWDIKSTTKAKDGIYQYDALRRLQDVNLEETKAQNIEEYISYGRLAQAFTEKQNGTSPNILLIDEIDKADIDFPNDLLLELDNRTFVVPELGKKGRIEATSDVLIIITSNQEKELPPAFLRRCLFHFIEFPEDKLADIVRNHVDNLEDDLIKKALKVFKNIRDNLSDSDKQPSTSELIDWFKMIDFYTQLKKDKPENSKRTSAQNRLIDQLDLIGTPKIPFEQILLKTRTARQKLVSNDE